MNAEQVEVIDADISTITAAADKVFRVIAPSPCLAQIEVQASYDASLPDRCLAYSVLLRRRHNLPVRSLVLLLRKEALGPAMTGALEYRLPEGESYLLFRYAVLRVWELPADEILAGGLGTLALAPLSNVSEHELPGVIRRMDERITAETTREGAGLLWTAAYVLLGLRYPAELIQHLLEGVQVMQESTTYQAIVAEGRTAGLAQGRELGLAEGRAEEARNILLRLGRKRFGQPPAGIVRAIEAMDELTRMEQLVDRLLDATDWEQWLRG